MSGVFILPPEKLFLFGSKYVLIYKSLHFCSYPTVNISAIGGIQSVKHCAADLRNIYKSKGTTSTAVIYMNQLKRCILRIIGQKAAARAAALSEEYIRARPEEKEAIVAGIDFERWLSEVSQECLR